jgi:hypothetical protein
MTPSIAEYEEGITRCDWCKEILKLEEDNPWFYFGRASDLTKRRADDPLAKKSWGEAKRAGWTLVVMCRPCYDARGGVIPTR